MHIYSHTYQHVDECNNQGHMINAACEPESLEGEQLSPPMTMTIPCPSFQEG